MNSITIISLLASTALILGLKKGMVFNIVAAVLYFVAIASIMFDLSGGFNAVNYISIFSVAGALFCDGVIIGIKSMRKR